MPNIPVRNLGGVGIISDINVYDLPPHALSSGVNVRFENGKVTRAPLFRRVHEFPTTPDFSPAHILAIPPISTGVESLVVVAEDYSRILSVTGETVVDMTPLGLTEGVTFLPVTHCILGGVTYINRGDNVPLSKTSSDAGFIKLPHWDASWRCQALRSYKDTVIAMNVIKGADVFPSMVKWSDFAGFNQVPGDWDATSTTNSAGENILNEMEGPIVDGATLGDTFYIYGENEVWAMNYIGGPLIYDFRKRFNDRGVLNTNCVVEVDGLHYVFGRNDIYVHDGSSPRSIVHGQNKDYIFDSILKQYNHLAFVSHDPKLNEIHFCYVSDDQLVGFRGTTAGANRAAVFNYKRSTWSFYDLPCVRASTNAAVVTGMTYEDAADTVYPEAGGTYLGEADEAEKHVLFVGCKDTLVGLSQSRIYGFTPASGGRLNKPFDSEANKPAFVERIGIDLDESDVPLTAYKSLLSIYPQIGLAEPTDLAQFQFGATDVTGQSPLWDIPRPFDPARDNKVDIRVAGRYLGYRLYFSGSSDFAFSGFDARITVRGKR